jgi:hypothetical protein
MYLNIPYRHHKYSVFTVYCTRLSVAQTTQDETVGRLVNNELDKMLMEAPTI